MFNKLLSHKEVLVDLEVVEAGIDRVDPVPGPLKSSVAEPSPSEETSGQLGVEVEPSPMHTVAQVEADPEGPFT